MRSSRLLILAAAVLWSTSGAAAKLCQLSGWQIAAGRALVAGLVLLALHPRARARPSRHVAAVALVYAAMSILFMVATKLTTAANAIFLQDTAPLYVLFLSWARFGERPSRGELAAVPIFLLGLVLFFVDQLHAGGGAGNAVALASGVAFALTILGLHRATPAESEAVLVWGNLLASVVALPMGLGGPAPRLLDVGLVLFLGVFQMGLAYACFNRGLRETPAVEASLLVLLEPVLNPIWTFLLVGERPGPWAILGGAIILGATVWRTLQAHRPVPGVEAGLRD